MDIKTDPALGDGTGTTKQAQVQVLESSLAFQQAAETYLERLKKDMYELMEQPLPENLVNVASGKALRMLYDDLITRCEEKWKAWDEAIFWLFDLIRDVVELGNLYTDNPLRTNFLLECSVDLDHNYPIPDDELETKTLAIQEVEANVRSHQSYIRDFGTAEEADKEFSEILDEMDQINTSENAGLMTGGVNNLQ